MSILKSLKLYLFMVLTFTSFLSYSAQKLIDAEVLREQEFVDAIAFQVQQAHAEKGLEMNERLQSFQMRITTSLWYSKHNDYKNKIKFSYQKQEDITSAQELHNFVVTDSEKELIYIFANNILSEANQYDKEKNFGKVDLNSIIRTTLITYVKQKRVEKVHESPNYNATTHISGIIRQAFITLYPSSSYIHVLTGNNETKVTAKAVTK